MIDKYKVYIAIAAIISLVIIVVALNSITAGPTSVSRPSATSSLPPNYASDTNIPYTNAITDERMTDSPNKMLEVTSRAPTVQVDGLDAIYSTNLSNKQADSVHTAIIHYLAARAGVAIVKAGIQNQQITRSGDSMSFSFILMVYQPEITAYNVTVQLDPTDPLGGIPNLLFKDAD